MNKLTKIIIGIIVIIILGAFINKKSNEQAYAEYLSCELLKKGNCGPMPPIPGT